MHVVSHNYLGLVGGEIRPQDESQEQNERHQQKKQNKKMQIDQNTQLMSGRWVGAWGMGINGRWDEDNKGLKTTI